MYKYTCISERDKITLSNVTLFINALMNTIFIKFTVGLKI
jgi:hypothetical protein